MERLTILKKSEHCRDHGAAQSAKILETAFVSEEMGNEFHQAFGYTSKTQSCLI